MAQDYFPLTKKEALEKGQNRESIRNILSQAGWEIADIHKALASFAELDYPLAVPKPAYHASAREAFLYLVLFMTLGVSAISLGTILFQLINLWLPDPIYVYDGYINSVKSTLRNATAGLMVSFPIFLYVSHLTERGIHLHPELRLSRPRTFITYAALFIASGIMIGTLITLLANLLGGELTMRFVLKTTSVLLISGTIFGHYLHQLKGAEEQKKNN